MGDNKKSEVPLPGVIPESIAKKMPWWGYLIVTIMPLISGYGGSIMGAASQAKENATEISALKKSVDGIVTVVSNQNRKITRLTIVIASTSDIDINTLIPPEQ